MVGIGPRHVTYVACSGWLLSLSSKMDLTVNVLLGFVRNCQTVLSPKYLHHVTSRQPQADGFLVPTGDLASVSSLMLFLMRHLVPSVLPCSG